MTSTALDLPEDTNAALTMLEARGTKAEKSFAELVQGTSVVEGRSLRDKGEMIGVPHIITTVSFRPTGEGKSARDFVSVEAVDVNNLAIVYNDGSTGVRRQIVEYLSAHGAVKVENPDDNIVRDPALGSLTFEFSNDGVGIPTLAAPRGLRVSQYRNEFGEAETYYLA